MSVAIPQVGDVIAGKYRVESVLGRGGMGVVFAARHTISERRVAVKWMEADLQNEPDALERFVREARAMGRIEHPNVVGVLDVGTEGPVAYLVMEILRGESLRALIAREHRLSPEKALRTLLPVLEGVEAAHRAGVVHRDLKPENLFVVHGPGGEPTTTKVLDFGISKLTESESKKREARRLTKTGHVVGTPTYMAPEQVRGSSIDARTDVWALATILYEMLTGTTPFEADNFGALLVAIAVEPYKPLDPALVPPDLARVVHRGLAKEPEDRWPTVLDFARALEPFTKGARFQEPRRPSMMPAEPERASSMPTKGGPVHPGLAVTAPPLEPPSPVDVPTAPPIGTKTPELDLPAPRLSPPAPRASAPASPTPIRIARPSTPSETTDTSALVPSGNGRMVAIAAVAVVVLVGAVLVIRGIGNAARDASLTPVPPTSVALTPPPPATHAAPPTSVVAAPPPPTTIAAPMTAVPVTIVGVDPPPTSHTRHGDHVRVPATVLGVTVPPVTTTAPPPTTEGSRSGSISRDDF